MNRKDLYKLVSFLVMSDGGVYKSSSGKNYYFVLTQREDHLDFCEYTVNILNNITSVRIKYVDRSADRDANRRNQYRVETLTHPIYTQMHDRIYIGNYKSIDPHYLKLLDWESLAILYMSDGSLKKDFRPEIGMKNTSYDITLNMKRLSYGDTLLLKRRLEESSMGCWNINRQNQYYYLRLSSKYIPMFIENIEKYILPSFKYKVDIQTVSSL